METARQGQAETHIEWGISPVGEIENIKLCSQSQLAAFTARLKQEHAEQGMPGFWNSFFSVEIPSSMDQLSQAMMALRACAVGHSIEPQVFNNGDFSYKLEIHSDLSVAIRYLSFPCGNFDALINNSREERIGGMENWSMRFSAIADATERLQLEERTSVAALIGQLFPLDLWLINLGLAPERAQKRLDDTGGEGFLERLCAAALTGMGALLQLQEIGNIQASTWMTSTLQAEDPTSTLAEFARAAAHWPSSGWSLGS